MTPYSSQGQLVKAVLRPMEDALGHYSLSVQTGAMAAALAAASEILQFRWTHATNLCLIKEIRFDGAGSIVAFDAGAYVLEAVMARAFTAAGTGGGTATLTTNNGKLRTVGMATTSVGSVRVATTAALGAGTKTLDTQGIGALVGGLANVAGAGLAPGLLFGSPLDSEHPIILAQNEGVIVRATVPATGTWTGGVTIKWAELAASPY